MDAVELYTDTVTATGTRKTCELVDSSCQTDPVIILPLPPDITAPSSPPSSVSTHTKPITPIYKPSRSRRKKTPIKLDCQVSQESDDDDLDQLYIPKSQISAIKESPSYKPKSSIQVSVGKSTCIPAPATLHSAIKPEFYSSTNMQSMAVETRQIIPTPLSASPCRQSSKLKNENGLHPTTNRVQRFDSSKHVPSKQAVSVIKSVDDDSVRVGRFKCLLCPYANNHKIALELHSIIHDSQPPYSCRKCAFSSADVVAFNVHVRHHTGEQKFTCYHPGCDYTSNNSSNLKRHCRSHKETKPYHKLTTKTSGKPASNLVLSDDSSSDTAPARSVTGMAASVLKIPSLHHSPKPAATVLNQLADVVNGISSKGFPTMAKDMRSHKASSNMLQCEQCEYHTTNPTNLRRHKVKHRLHRSHKCTSCNYATNYLGNMRRHFEVRHKGTPFDKATSFAYRMGSDTSTDDMTPVRSSYDTSVVMTKSKRPLVASADLYEMDRKRVKYPNESRKSSKSAEHSMTSIPKTLSPTRREDSSQISSLALLQQMVLQKY